MNTKLVIFDLDGVIIDSRELHYKALNDALSQISRDYVISREEHLSTFDGLPTTKKLWTSTITVVTKGTKGTKNTIVDMDEITNEMAG